MAEKFLQVIYRSSRTPACRQDGPVSETQDLLKIQMTLKQVQHDCFKILESRYRSFALLHLIRRFYPRLIKMYVADAFIPFFGRDWRRIGINTMQAAVPALDD